jgi:rare lipoprotein A
MKRSSLYFAAWSLSVIVALSVGMYLGAKVILGLKAAEVREADGLIEALEREADDYVMMIASWYGPRFHGRRTANMEIYDMNEMTAAHRSLPFGTILLLEYQGRYAVCRINDRGPFVDGRHLDVSRAVAEALGLVEPGVAEVRARVIMCGRPSVGD